tara:strand:+ start:253 stop:606 length:354 start_codon:yes stop_codon:yes gene_type:complete
MNSKQNYGLWIGIFIASFILLSAFNQTTEYNEYIKELSVSDVKLRQTAFEILENKCNVCHRKQNPLMVFKEKNISKRAKKIYQMVFVENRMPKGNDIRLTNEEYIVLEKWIKSQENS